MTEPAGTPEQLFPEQLEPVVMTPDEQTAAGVMPQIPYEKLERFPDGWADLGEYVVTKARRWPVQDVVTDRMVTLVKARQWMDHDDPDRPQTPVYRVALFGVAADEGLDAEWWAVVDQEGTDDPLMVGILGFINDAETATVMYDQAVAAACGVEGRDGRP